MIEKIRVSKGQVQFGFQSVDGFTYVVQATETLAAPLQWQTISTCMGDGSWKSVGEPIDSGQRFFRIVVR